MNLFGFLSLVIVLALAVWFLGNGIEEDNAPEQGVFQNTLDAAKGAADQLGN
jgi:hypothetical protein